MRRLLVTGKSKFSIAQVVDNYNVTHHCADDVPKKVWLVCRQPFDQTVRTASGVRQWLVGIQSYVARKVSSETAVEVRNRKMRPCVEHQAKTCDAVMECPSKCEMDIWLDE